MLAKVLAECVYGSMGDFEQSKYLGKVIVEMLAKEMRLDIYPSSESRGCEQDDLYWHRTRVYQQLGDVANLHKDSWLVQCEWRKDGKVTVYVNAGFMELYEVVMPAQSGLRLRHTQIASKDVCVFDAVRPDESRTFVVYVAMAKRAGILKGKGYD